MNLRHLNKVVIITIGFSTIGCLSKDCKEIEERDIVGYYVSMNSQNENLQYLEILENGGYFNRYCLDGKFVEEFNKWEYSKICTVTLRNIFWLNSQLREDRGGDAVFGFNYGKILSMGDDHWSFKKVMFKPKLECE